MKVKQMTDFNKILDKAKELEAKMKESQENIKKIRVEGISGSNSIKVTLDGNGEMQKIEISAKCRISYPGATPTHSEAACGAGAGPGL